MPDADTVRTFEDLERSLRTYDNAVVVERKTSLTISALSRLAAVNRGREASVRIVARRHPHVGAASQPPPYVMTLMPPKHFATMLRNL